MVPPHLSQEESTTRLLILHLHLLQRPMPVLLLPPQQLLLPMPMPEQHHPEVMHPTLHLLLPLPLNLRKMSSSSPMPTTPDQGSQIFIQDMDLPPVTPWSSSEVVHLLSTSTNTLNQNASSATPSPLVPTFHARRHIDSSMDLKASMTHTPIFASSVKTVLHSRNQTTLMSLSRCHWMDISKMFKTLHGLNTTNLLRFLLSSHHLDQKMVVPLSRFGVKASLITARKQHAHSVLRYQWRQ